MKKSELNYDYPESLIALSPERPTRVMWCHDHQSPQEISISQLIEKIPAGDIFVINNTKVLKRRVFAANTEILFLDQLTNQDADQNVNQDVNQNADQNVNQLASQRTNQGDCNEWSVLFPSKKFSIGDKLQLPMGFQMELLEKGRPQRVRVTPAITQIDFDQIAELPLPPYIQKARAKRHTVAEDENWYQTAWAEKAGSFAAPTASLHFANADILNLKNRGVHVVQLTLHVGLGTFLPVLTDDLDDHTMHEEFYHIEHADWQQVKKAKLEKKGIWSLGTTTTRVLESVARTERLSGKTDILLQVGSEFKIVDRLLTNFHQPESTLLAMVSGFSSLHNVKRNYAWAIEKKFKLFSYGDLSVWVKN